MSQIEYKKHCEFVLDPWGLSLGTNTYTLTLIIFGNVVENITVQGMDIGD